MVDLHALRSNVQRVLGALAHPRSLMERAVVGYLFRLGFLNIHRFVVHGPEDRVHLGKEVGSSHNAVLNTRSGHIYVGDNTCWSHNCMFITGRHEFENGKLKQPRTRQVPTEGYDIRIGSGCWIASGVIIIGGVTIGDDCIVAAGAVVTRNFPDGCVIGGVPAKMMGQTNEIDNE